jgi:hypothetical protein
MKIHLLLAAAALSIAGFTAAGSACAATYVFDFQNSDPTDAYGDVAVSGTFTASSTLASAISAISGTVSGAPAPLVNGVIDAISPYADADNILYATGVDTNNNVSFGGVSFDVSGETYNLYTYNGGTYLLASSIDPVGYPQNGTPGTFSVTLVPEPATWAVMLVGFGGLGVAMRSRRKLATSIT